MEENILIVKKTKEGMHFKVTERRFNNYGGKIYEKIISSHNPSQLADMFYYLSVVGFPINEAIRKFRELEKEPSLFFLK